MKTLFFCFVMTIFLSGCATSFTGNAHIEKRACVEKCARSGLDFVGMVYMGEYTSGCICSQKKDRMGQYSSADDEFAVSAASSVVGVVLQARSQNHHHHHHAMF